MSFFISTAPEEVKDKRGNYMHIKSLDIGTEADIQRDLLRLNVNEDGNELTIALGHQRLINLKHRVVKWGGTDIKNTPLIFDNLRRLNPKLSILDLADKKMKEMDEKALAEPKNEEEAQDPNSSGDAT